MSNGEDVLDNWEEIDEVELDHKLEQIKKDIKGDLGSTSNDTNLNDSSMSFRNSVPLMMVMQPEDEYNTSYAQDKPTVKILRRPTQQSNDSRANDIRRKPIKTLQQREQEYAEARLRILGSAKNPDDDKSSPVAAANLNIGPTLSENTLFSNNVSNIESVPVRSQDNILRMPKGPDAYNQIMWLTSMGFYTDMISQHFSSLVEVLPPPKQEQ